MKAILLCAGKGVRFRPVTDSLPKPLLPFLNVPLARAHLRRLQQAGVGEVAVNLHHLGDQIQRDLSQQAAESSEARVFRGARDSGHRGRAAQRGRVSGRRRLPAGQLRRGDRPRLRRIDRSPPRLGTSRDAPRDREPAPGSVHAASVRRGSHHGLRGPRTKPAALHWRLRPVLPAPAAHPRRRDRSGPPPLAADSRRGAGRAWLRPPSWPARRSRPPGRFPPRVARNALARRTVSRRSRQVRSAGCASSPEKRRLDSKRPTASWGELGSGEVRPCGDAPSGTTSRSETAPVSPAASSRAAGSPRVPTMRKPFSSPTTPATSPSILCPGSMEMITVSSLSLLAGSRASAHVPRRP